MKKTRFTRLTAAFLSLLMLGSSFSAMTTGVCAAGAEINTEEIQMLLNAKNYSDYAADGKDVARGVIGEKTTPTIAVENGRFTPLEGDTKLVVSDDELVIELADGKVMLAPSSGKITWDIEYPEEYVTSKWNIEIKYAFPDENGVIGKEGDKFYIPLPDLDPADETQNGLEGKSTHIERRLYINDTLPFKETRYLQLTKTWQDDSWKNKDHKFTEDSNGNDKRPTKTIVCNDWSTYTVSDSSGYEIKPFEFVLDANEDKTLTLEATREAMVIQSIKFVPYEKLPTYKQYQASHKNAKAVKADPVILEAEHAMYTSDKTIYAANDRTSAITSPQDTSKSKLNTLGGTKWQSIGQWIEYEFDVPETGLYAIVPRFKQADLAGMYTSRRIYINGEVPFEEANYLQFNYSDSWKTAPLNNGDVNNGFEFYLEKGKNTIRFEVVLGEMGDIIGRVQDCLTSINNDYLKILQITGADPDQYRDYNFRGLIPDTIRDLYEQYLTLSEVSKTITDITGAKGSNTATLDNIARVLEKMSTDEDEVAKNMSQLKSYIGTLGTWLNNVRNQPVLFDYISIQSADAKLPRAEANFFESAGFEIGSFVMSFFTDYSNLGASGEKIPEERQIDVWVATGRDQAQVIRSMCDNQFSTYLKQNGYDKVGVNLRLVTGGTLLPATLSGSGPDVALQNAQTLPVEYAIRSAVLPLNNFDTFEDVKSRFSNSAMVPLTLYGMTYGLPETQSFPMMFYRKDIFAELFPDEEFPETWDDLMEMVPVLQYNNMQVGIPTNYGGLQLFLYQMGENLYDGIEYDTPGSAEYGKGEYRGWYGSRVNLDNNTVLEAFDTLCSYFTQYSFPITYDAANRFRTGEMPIIFSDYVGMYNQLSIFATEIRDLWGFAPVLGMPVLDENGDETYYDMIDYVDEKGNPAQYKKIYTKEQMAAKGLTENDLELNINNLSVSTITTMVMMRSCEEAKQDSAWRFMDWYTTSDAQAHYANEMVAIVGQGAMHASANMDALAELPWSTADYNNIMQQHDKNLAAIPEMPGGYIISRYVGFAFLAAYNEQADPVEELLDYVDDINKEITRKRNEFGLDTLELGEEIKEKVDELKKAK